MNTLIWCAFDASSLSDIRCSQIRSISHFFALQPCILCTNEISVPAEFSSVQIDRRSADIHNPSAAANIILDTAYHSNASAVCAPQTPAMMRILSLAAAAADAPFINGFRSDSLPQCARNICAGRLIETILPPSHPFFAAIALSAAPLNSLANECHPIAETMRSAYVCEPNSIAIETFAAQLRIEGAHLIFAGGRGLGSKDTFEKLALCAEKYGAGLAASRIAVDLGWCRNDRQVGQTGHSVAPDTYVAFGISGAVQHIAGIRNARRIFAVNTDKNAPIFCSADLGLVADAQSVIEALLACA